MSYGLRWSRNSSLCLAGIMTIYLPVRRSACPGKYVLLSWPILLVVGGGKSFGLRRFSSVQEIKINEDFAAQWSGINRNSRESSVALHPFGFQFLAFPGTSSWLPELCWRPFMDYASLSSRKTFATNSNYLLLIEGKSSQLLGNDFSFGF